MGVFCDVLILGIFGIIGYVKIRGVEFAFSRGSVVFGGFLGAEGVADSVGFGFLGVFETPLSVLLSSLLKLLPSGPASAAKC